jgi:hypothetical protein
VAVLPTIYKIEHSWHDVLEKDGALLGCGMGKHHLRAKFSIPVMAEYRLPQKMAWSLEEH